MVEVKKIKINKITPNKYNPNTMNSMKFDALVNNIKKEGEMLQPILINKNMVIIDGEHRWKASKKAGLKEIWCVIAESTDEESKLKTVSFNNIKGKFNPLKLNDLLVELMNSIDLNELSTMLAINTSKLENVSKALQEQFVDTDFDDMFTNEGEMDTFDDVVETQENKDRVGHFNQLKVKKERKCPNCGHVLDD